MARHVLVAVSFFCAAAALSSSSSSSSSSETHEAHKDFAKTLPRSEVAIAAYLAAHPQRAYFSRLFRESGPYATGIEVGVAGGRFSEHIVRDGRAVRDWLMIEPYPTGELRARLNGLENGTATKPRTRTPLSLVTALSLDEPALTAARSRRWDFVYLDGAHDYDNVKKELEPYYSVLAPGGMLAGHDYCSRFPFAPLACVGCADVPRCTTYTEYAGDATVGTPVKSQHGVVRAVQEWLSESHPWTRVYHTQENFTRDSFRKDGMDYDLIITKTRNPSWFLFKEEEPLLLPGGVSTDDDADLVHKRGGLPMGEDERGGRRRRRRYGGIRDGTSPSSSSRGGGRRGRRRRRAPPPMAAASPTAIRRAREEETARSSSSTTCARGVLSPGWSAPHGAHPGGLSPNPGCPHHLEKEQRERAENNNDHKGGLPALTVALLYGGSSTDRSALRALVAAAASDSLRRVARFLVVDYSSDDAKKRKKNAAAIGDAARAPGVLAVYDVHDGQATPAGARNLATVVAPTDWVVTTDAAVTEQGVKALARRLLSSVSAASSSAIFSPAAQWWRVLDDDDDLGLWGNNDQGEHHTLLSTKTAYWRAGGCDEDLRGASLRPFQWRAARTAGLVDAGAAFGSLVGSASSDDGEGDQGHDPQDAALYAAKKANQVPWSQAFLRFKWRRLSSSA